MYEEIDALMAEEIDTLDRINKGEFDLVERQLQISKRFCELYEVQKIPKRWRAGE